MLQPALLRDALDVVLLFLLGVLGLAVIVAYQRGCWAGHHGPERLDTQIRGREIWTVARCARCAAILRERWSGEIPDGGGREPTSEPQPPPVDVWWS